jgi:uncharacterized membrane protein
MMFLWLPLLFLIPLAIFWTERPAAAERGGTMHGAHPQAAVPMGEDPNEIVRKRLAQGEITVSEFEEIRRVIGN